MQYMRVSDEEMIAYRMSRLSLYAFGSTVVDDGVLVQTRIVPFKDNNSTTYSKRIL